MSETEYDLEPDSEHIEDVEPPADETVRKYVPGQPLPRLWKTEPDPDEEGVDQTIDQPARKKKASKDRDALAPAPRFPSQAGPKAKASKPARPKPKADDAPKGEKRVLVEETPAFDTYETRQRARRAVGGLMLVCLFIFGWIVYGMIFPGSNGPEPESAELPPEATKPVVAGPSREPEARYMLDHAREYAKKGRVTEAIAMLERIVSVYRGTSAAGEAQAALERPRQNLPLFPERPYLVAEKAAPSHPPVGQAAPPSPSRPAASPPGPATTRVLPPELAGGSPPPVPPRGPAPMPPGPSTNAVQSNPAPSPPPSYNPATVAANPPSGPTYNPGAASPPPAPGSHPAPASPPPPPGSGMTPGMVGAATARGPAIAGNTPPAGAPGAGAGPAPGTSLGNSGQPAPPPPGSVNATIVVPGNTMATTAPSPAGPGGFAPATAERGAPAPDRPARKLPPGFRARPEAGYHESGWPMAIVGDRDGALMVLVPGGTFLMGHDRSEGDDGPAHPVQLSTFYIDQHEVTNRQFRTFLDDTRYRGQPPGKWLTDPRMRALPDEAPAVFVSYQDAEEYAIWAQKRLPTEAQWEMAARSVDGRRHPWGDEPVRWSRPRRLQQVEPVMSFPQDVSPYGVFDLAGNAVEWVRDWYDPAYYARLRDKTTLDPTGPPSKRQGIQRVARGNSKDWLMYARQGMDSDRRLPYLGFRCSLAVEGGEASALIAPHPVKPPASPPVGQPGNDVVPF